VLFSVVLSSCRIDRTSFLSSFLSAGLRVEKSIALISFNLSIFALISSVLRATAVGVDFSSGLEKIKTA